MINHSLSNNNSIPAHKKGIVLDLFTFIKIGLVSATIVFLITNSQLNFALQTDDVVCLNDKLMKLTDPINQFLIENEKGRKAFTIISSLLIDLVFLGLMTYWILFVRSWRVVVAYLCFYLTRMLVQAMFILSFPEGYTFLDPGFPSLFVSYAKTSDFFYSGHIAMPLIAGLEFLKNQMVPCAIVCFCVSLLEGSFMLFTRAHYSIDLVAGLIFAHYFYLLADKYIHYLDEPFFKACDGICLVTKTGGDEENNLDRTNYKDEENSSYLEEENKLLGEKS